MNRTRRRRAKARRAMAHARKILKLPRIKPEWVSEGYSETGLRTLEILRAIYPQGGLPREAFVGGIQRGRHPLMLKALAHGWVTLDEYVDSPQTFIVRVWPAPPPAVAILWGLAPTEAR